jgi:hypothetical protein
LLWTLTWYPDGLFWIILIFVRLSLTHPSEEPSLGALSSLTIGPASVAVPLCMCAAVAGLLLDTVSV